MRLGDLWRWPVALLIGVIIGQAMLLRGVTLADASKSAFVGVKLVADQFRGGTVNGVEAKTAIPKPALKPNIELDTARSTRERV